MPSEYTRPIEIGEITSAKDYIMRCARACTVLAFMVDEPLDKPIPEVIEEGSYYKDRLSKHKDELERLKNMNSDDIHEAHVKEVEETREYLMNCYKEAKAKKEKYDAILEQLESWNPTEETYLRLKEFAIEQIRDSCPVEAEYNAYLKGAEEQSASMVPFIDTMNNETDEEWYNHALVTAEKYVNRYEQRVMETSERVRLANEWVSGLRKSLEDM